MYRTCACPGSGCRAWSWRTSVRHLLKALTALCLSTAATALTKQHAPPSWQAIHRQSADVQGTAYYPSVRYGHTVAAHAGRLLTSHGYFFDHGIKQASWKADTWAMSMSPPYTWTLVSPGITHVAAHAAYSAGRAPAAPSGRFGQAAAVSNHTLWMYGGHDGGTSRHGRDAFELGYDFEELWQLDLSVPKPRWALVETLSGAGGPGKRYLAAMAGVAGQLLLYGGLAHGQGDVWALDIATARWRLLTPEKSDGSGPGRRVGHSLTPIQFPGGGAQGFVLVGGRHIAADGTTSLAADAWFFDLGTASWRQLRSVSVTRTSGSGIPAARMYHAEAHTYVRVQAGGKAAALVGVVLGGSTSTPHLTCAADAWAFLLDCALTSIKWLPLPHLPVALYDLRAAADSKAVFAFGGHLCAATDGYPVLYTNQVVRLELAPLLAGVTPQGCAIDVGQLLDEAPLPHGGGVAEL